MCLQNSILCKWHNTFGTRTWLLYFINPLMGFQTTTLYKSLITFWMDKWLFSVVCHWMCFQLTNSQKCLVTLATRKWLLSYMDPCMPLDSLHDFVYMTCKIEQVNDFPPLRTFSCVVKEWSRTNYFSQLGQGKGFSPVWILSCLFNVWKWNVTFGASKWPLFCVSHVMFFKITLVFKGLVTFGTGKHLPPGVNPFRNHHFVYLQRSYKCKFAHEKDLGLIILCFGTYSTLSISFWDLFHSFNISFWTYFSLNNHLPPVLYLIFFQKSWVE